MSLFSELRRRNVFGMLVLYVVGAWVVVQVVESIFPGFDIPESSIRFVWIAAVLGLPIALVFSWRFDVTVKGIKRTPSVQEGTVGLALKTVDHVLLVGLGAVAIAVLVVLSQEIVTTREDAADSASIAGAWDPPEQAVAVLPFVNMSADEDNAHFSDGLADTVLHMLAQVPELMVPARTSSFHPSLKELDIGEIGRRLNVGMVLEGSVQLSGDKLRVIAQLIDVSDGYHRWSRTFDRDFDDIFAIQDEIANEVVEAITKTSMSAATMAQLNLGGTDNTEAYTEYLLAVGKFNPMTSMSADNAMPHVQKALDLDPDYALAHAMLGRIYTWKALDMGKTQASAAARDAVNRALEIAPDLPDALGLLAYIEFWDDNEDKGQQLLRRVLEIDRNNIRALSLHAGRLAQEWRPAESLAASRRIISLDPLDERGYVGVTGVLWAQGKMSEALETALRFKDVRPDSLRALNLVALCHFSMGEYAADFRLSDEIFALDPAFFRASELGASSLLMDMVEEARRRFDLAASIDPDNPSVRVHTILLNYYLQQNEEENLQLAREFLLEENGLTGINRDIALIVLTESGARLGQQNIVLETLQDLYPHLFDDSPHDFDNADLSTFFSALVLLRSGDIDQGTLLMKAYLKERDRWDDAYTVSWTSIAGRVALGDIDAALTRENGFRKTMYLEIGVDELTMFRHSTLFDPIRDEPEFIELLELYETNAAEQRRLLQAANEAT